MKLLEPKPAEGIETSDLERVRDDLSTVLRLVKATGS